MVKHVERNFAGRALKLEAGRLAKQAAGSCLVQFGETVVLAAVTVSDNVSTRSLRRARLSPRTARGRSPRPVWPGGPPRASERGPRSCVLRVSPYCLSRAQRNPRGAPVLFRGAQRDASGINGGDPARR